MTGVEFKQRNTKDAGGVLGFFGWPLKGGVCPAFFADQGIDRKNGTY